MTARNTLTIAGVAAALGALIAPALAQNGSSKTPSPSDHGTSMGHMGRDMMGGCAEMMQSMNNGGNGTPNSRWQRQPRRNKENGG